MVKKGKTRSFSYPSCALVAFVVNISNLLDTPDGNRHRRWVSDFSLRALPCGINTFYTGSSRTAPPSRAAAFSASAFPVIITGQAWPVSRARRFRTAAA